LKFNKIYYYLAFVFYFATAFLYVFNNYQTSKNSLISEIDSNLTRGALSVPVILPDGFHKVDMSKEDVSEEEDMANIKRLSVQAKISSLQYIYSYIKRDGKILFTSSSATDEELAKNENLSHYFDVYESVRDRLNEVFTTQKITFDESIDKWGHFRSVYIPQKSADGQTYVVCADVKIDFIQSEMRRVLKESVAEMLFYIIILIPLFAAYHYHNKQINEELEAKVKERTKQVKTLLNNADQGFLSFSSDMLVHNEYSSKCSEIFGCEIGGKNIAELLFEQDDKAANAFTQHISALIGDEDTLRVENILSLLCNEFVICGKNISAEYKMVDSDSFMIILTDITEKKVLEKNLEKEKNRLKMVVSAVANPSEFFELLEAYHDFIDSRISLVDMSKTSLYNISEIYRAVHTFKGLFAQKEFIITPQGLHKLETRLSKFLSDSKTTNDDIVAVLKKVEIESWLERDLTVLRQILGDDFFDKKDKITVSTEAINTLRDKIRFRAEQSGINEKIVAQLTSEVERLKQQPLVQMLSSYPKLLEQLAVRLGKNLYPVQIICDKEIFVDDICKPFIRSLIHVFRNSIDHGIENAEDRAAIGKDYSGTISCAVGVSGDDLQITIADDGTGLDLTKIAKKALEKGLYTKDELEAMSNEEVALLIFHDNFSTSEEVNELSGRGVGLAALKAELDNLGGHMKVSTDTGNGTTFTFFIPLHDKRTIS